MSTPKSTYTISQIADELDISTRTIRFYEEKGLISPKRTNGNQRIYTSRNKARLKLILRGKRFGFSLDEIADMIGMANADPDELEQIEKKPGIRPGQAQRDPGQKKGIGTAGKRHSFHQGKAAQKKKGYFVGYIINLIGGCPMNLIEVIEKNAATTPDKTGLCDLQTSYTFWKMVDESKQMAAKLQGLGIQKGDAVALMGQNSFDWVFSYFGILLCGAVAVPVNHKLTARETSFILEDCGAKLFLFDGALVEVAKGIELSIRKLAIDSPASGFDLLRDQKSDSYTPVSVTDEDTAQILYTSGTTGNPKGCIHTHAGVCVAGSTGQKAISLTSEDRMLVAMPIWHSSPLNNWFAGITIAGGTTVILREYHPLHFLQIVQERQCTVYFGAPISYLLPLQMIPNFGEFDLTSMRAWIYGGGPIAPETVKKLAATYKTDRFYQVYGMTESGPTGTSASAQGP